jgi:hypothetical protein
MASGRSRDAAVDLEVALGVGVGVALLCMVALPLITR